MGEDKPRLEVVAITISVLIALLLLLLRTASEAVVEMGDGVNHYMIARYAWGHPELFLDLWGKPVFTLLASPFAQIGHFGVAAFNTIVAGATAIVGVKALRHAGGAAQTAFPLFVLLAPQYVLMVIAGMTEPLFGLVTGLTLFMLLKERYVAAAIIASLSPLARPEYIAFLPCVILWLAAQRQWRALPWCLFGLALYAVLTTVTRGEPLWFWTGDPYSYAGNVYGSGPLDFFVSQAGSVYGRPLLALGVCALVAWPFVYRHDRGRRREHRLMLLCAALPAVGIVAIHSLLWFKGWRGSAGLLRVLVTSIPMAGLFTAFTLGRAAIVLFKHRRAALVTTWIVLPVLGIWAVDDLTERVSFPMRPEMNQRFLDSAVDGMEWHWNEGSRIFSTLPYLPFRAGFDPFDTATYRQVFRADNSDIPDRMKPGDLMVWDAHFGSNECGLALENLLDDHRLAVVEAFEPPEGVRVLGGHVYEIFLFERRDVMRSHIVDTLIWNGMLHNVPAMRADTINCATTIPARWCMKEGEFPLEIRDLPPPEAGTIYYEFIVSGNVTVEDGSRLTVVYTEKIGDHGVRYDQEDVVSGPFVFNRRVPPVGPGTQQSFYFWNLGGKPFTLEGFTVLRKKWTQHPA